MNKLDEDVILGIDLSNCADQTAQVIPKLEDGNLVFSSAIIDDIRETHE